MAEFAPKSATFGVWPTNGSSSSNRFLSDGSIGAPETIGRAVGGSTAMGYPNIPKSALPNGSDFSADVWIRSCTKSIREADLLLERSPTLVFAGSVTIYRKGHKMDDSGEPSGNPAAVARVMIGSAIKFAHAGPSRNVTLVRLKLR